MSVHITIKQFIYPVIFLNGIIFVRSSSFSVLHTIAKTSSIKERKIQIYFIKFFKKFINICK